MEIKNVTVAGTGVLGAQIAFQTAFHGFDVNVYDINESALAKARGRFLELKEAYKKDLKATDDAVNFAFDNINYHVDLEQAVKDADLVIEAVPEVPQIKKEFYAQLAKVAPVKTLFATNSSSLLPSEFAADTGRPGKFLALHFANEIWKNNTAEIMKHPGTDEEVFQSVIAFAKKIGMVALPLVKEQPGYILNTLLMPFLDAAMELAVKGVADPHTVDKTWMIATHAPMGPFGIMDIVGMTTVYNVTLAKSEKNPAAAKAAEYIKQNYIDKNKMGTASGEGFYKYPGPAYADPDFTKS